MATFSERNGMKRAYTVRQLWQVLSSELKKFPNYYLFIDCLGGTMGFQKPTSDNPDAVEEFEFEGTIEDPIAYFRHGLVHPMEFKFDEGAFSFFWHLPFELDPQGGGDINLIFDFLELLHPLAVFVDRDKKGNLRYNKGKGQELYRNIINPELALASKPYKMLENGQTVESSNRSILELSEAALTVEGEDIVGKNAMAPIKSAVNNYLKRSASPDDKKAAIRSLADALESVRPMVKTALLTKDEGALFDIANNFAIRHNRDNQRSDYDKTIWYDWMYHVNLAAILTTIKIIKAQQAKNS